MSSHRQTSRPGLVTPVRLDPAGQRGPTAGQARGTAWRCTSRGFYVPAHVSVDDPLQRVAEASVVVPRDGALTGWAALRWLGGFWFDGTTGDGRAVRPVVIATGGRTLTNQPGIVICEEGLPPSEILHVNGVAVTEALRSACFEMRYASNDRLAVVALDMAAYADLVSIEEMWTYAVAHAGWTGVPRCRWGTHRADENAWSPTEVLMRLCWELDAGYPRPLCNMPVFDRAGRHLGTPDLIDPDAGVIGEYDGSLHLAGSQRARDIRRESLFREVGLETVTMVSADLVDPSSFVRRLDGAYRRSVRAAASARSWTLDQPPWWVPTETVAQRRVLDATEREVWLRHRRAA